jgi:hypothetical protein
MRIEPYNPSGDGIVAKIWECMRRNEPFLRDVKRLRAFSLISSELPEEHLEIAERNPIASLVFAEVIDSSGTSQTAIERRCWRELNDRIKERIREYVEHGLTTSPLRVEFAGFDPEARHPISGDKIKDQFFLVAIPKRLRDSEHRKKVIAWIENRVPRPATKAIHLRDNLPSGGKLLGTELDWKQFLFVEAAMYPSQRCPKGISREEALSIAAWRFYESDTFDPEAVGSAMGQLAAREVYTRRGDKVRSHLKAIEDGISSVYPSFSAFSGAG